MTIRYHFRQYVTIWKRVISTRFSTDESITVSFHPCILVRSGQGTKYKLLQDTL